MLVTLGELVCVDADDADTLGVALDDASSVEALFEPVALVLGPVAAGRTCCCPSGDVPFVKSTPASRWKKQTQKTRSVSRWSRHMRKTRRTSCHKQKAIV